MDFIGLKIAINHGFGLKAGDSNGLSDPYCKLTINGHSVKTKVIKKTLDPEWRQEFFISKAEIHSDTGILKLEFEVYDWDMVGKNELLGKAFHVIDTNVFNLNREMIERVSLDTQGQIAFCYEVQTKTLDDSSWSYRLLSQCMSVFLPSEITWETSPYMGDTKEQKVVKALGGSLYIAFRDFTKLGGDVDPHSSIIERVNRGEREMLGEKKDITHINPERYVHLYETRYQKSDKSIHICISGLVKCVGNVMTGFELHTSEIESLDEHYSNLMQIIKYSRVTSSNWMKNK